MSSSTCPTRTRTTETVRRLSAVAAIGALVGLPLAAPASAASPPSVTFTGGGSGGRSCSSKPDTPQISVQAEQRVRLTNQLGFDATLTLNGTADSPVANGETVEVQFHWGPVSVGMVPDCENPSVERLTVEVTQHGGPATPRPPRPNAKPSTTAPAGGNGPGHGPEDGSAPPGGPLFSSAATPGAEASGEANLESPATVVHPGNSGRGQALAGGPTPVDKGPIGILAIVATVCVIGVSSGAIRAIITQRATWTEFA